MISASQATICGRFTPLNTLVAEDADLDSTGIHVNNAANDIVAELLARGILGLPLRSYVFVTKELKKTRGELD